MNMVVFVVDCLEKHSPEKVPDEKAKRTHKLIVVAMFVEAIYALQHNKPSAFVAAIFGDSLAKVAAYTNITQRFGEGAAAFHCALSRDSSKSARPCGRRASALELSVTLRKRRSNARKLSTISTKRSPSARQSTTS